MIFKYIFKKNKKKDRDRIKYKFDINSWMDLSKADRLEIDSREKNESMRKKKALLKSIRDENKHESESSPKTIDDQKAENLIQKEKDQTKPPNLENSEMNQVYVSEEKFF